MAATAEHSGHDPDRIAFVAALRIARDSVAKGDFPPVGTPEAELIRILVMNTLTRRLNPPRRLRPNPRVVKRKVLGVGGQTPSPPSLAPTRASTADVCADA